MLPVYLVRFKERVTWWRWYCPSMQFLCPYQIFGTIILLHAQQISSIPKFSCCNDPICHMNVEILGVFCDNNVQLYNMLLRFNMNCCVMKLHWITNHRCIKVITKFWNVDINIQTKWSFCSLYMEVINWTFFWRFEFYYLWLPSKVHNCTIYTEQHVPNDSIT